MIRRKLLHRERFYRDTPVIPVALIFFASLARFVNPEDIVIAIGCGLTGAIAAVIYPGAFPGAVLLLWLLPQYLFPGHKNIAISTALVAALPIVVFKTIKHKKKLNLRYDKSAILGYSVVFLSIVLSYLGSAYEPNFGITVKRCACIVIAAIGSILVQGNSGKLVHLIFLAWASVLLTIRVTAVGNLLGAESLHSIEFIKIAGADPNYLSLYILIGVCPLIALISSNNINMFIKACAGALLLPCLISIVWLGSRMATLILMVLLIFNLYSSGTFPRWKNLTGVIILSIIFSVMFNMTPQRTLDSLNKRWHQKRSKLETMGGRLMIAEDSVRYIERTNFIDFLVGGGARYSYKVIGANTHNSFLEFQIDHGVIGFLSLFFLTVLGWRRSRNREAFLYKSCGGLVLVLMMGSLVLSPFVYYWSWLAMPALFVARSDECLPRARGILKNAPKRMFSTSVLRSNSRGER